VGGCVVFKRKASSNIARGLNYGATLASRNDVETVTTYYRYKERERAQMDMAQAGG
jgi:hypothetical protein